MRFLLELALACDQSVQNLRIVKNDKLLNSFYSRSDQKSREIYLEVGKKYYIEALLVDRYGAGYLSVAYKLPSGRQIKLLRSYWLSGRAD